MEAGGSEGMKVCGEVSSLPSPPQVACHSYSICECHQNHELGDGRYLFNHMSCGL